MRADQTAEKPVRRDTLAKGVGRIPAEYAGGAEVRPWVEGHSDPPGDSLLEKVVEPENMRRAWKQLRRNKEAAGVDGRDIGETLEFLRTNWADIRRQLLEGTYTVGCKVKCRISWSCFIKLLFLGVLH